MSALTLVIGNKAYSSWSLRPWLFMKVVGIPFQEHMINFFTCPEKRSELHQHSPASRVPILHDGDLTLWDSMAIMEYLAEKFPHATGWPSDMKKRAIARAVCAEMHAEFDYLRKELSFNCCARISKELSEQALQDVARINEIWTNCIERYGNSGPWLFGDFSIADAVFAPVALRFRTYEIAVVGHSKSYLEGILSLPAIGEWEREALVEG